MGLSFDEPITVQKQLQKARKEGLYEICKHNCRYIT